jgi:hypothetical protein
MTMTPGAFLATSALLGLMVLAAGAYGLLYAMGRMTGRRHLLVFAAVAYAVLAVDVACVVFASPLEFGWKLLIAASALAYLGIPPITWRHLRRTHEAEKGAHA